VTLRQLKKETRVLPRAFFDRPAEAVARDLLGTVLVRRANGATLAGRIVETEAYLGQGDRAAHSARGVTERTRVIFGPPARAYVYLIYGMHYCLNLVAEPEGTAGCVLLRALEPLCGVDEMRRLRPKARRDRDLASGPAKLTQALGVTLDDYGRDVLRGDLTVRAFHYPTMHKTAIGPRIGINESRELPLRFHIADNEHVSVR